MRTFQTVFVVFLAFLIGVNCEVENSTASEDETESTTDDFYCASSPCRNGGTCINEEDTYTCLCPKIYGGKNCSEDRICEIYGEKLCGNAKCFLNSEGSNFNCICDDGKIYDVTSNGCIEDHCASNPCKNSGTCWVSDDSYRCICSEMYSGKDCSDNLYCFLHGWSECGEATCHYDVVSQKVSCSCPSNEEFDEELKICKGPCTPNPCKSGGTCLADGSKFKCSCKFLYSGKICENGNKIMIIALLASLGTVVLASVLCGLFCHKRNQKLKMMSKPESYQAPRPVMALEHGQTNLYPTAPRF